MKEKKEESKGYLTKLAWPFIVLIVIIVFNKQIGKQFDRLTGVKVSGTEFSLILQNTAQEQNREGTYDIIRGLSRDGVTTLLNTGKSIHILNYEENDGSMHLSEDFGAYLELEKNGLLESNVNLEQFTNLNAEGIKNTLLSTGKHIEVRLSNKGEFAWDTIAESVNKAINP